MLSSKITPPRLSVLFSGRENDHSARGAAGVDLDAHMLAGFRAQYENSFIANAAKISGCAGDGGAARKRYSLRESLRQSR
jgi:hypothetical protein